MWLFCSKKWKIKADNHEKVQILKKVDFSEPWDQKKWIPHSICNKNHYVLGGKKFKIVLKIIVRFLPFWWLFENVSFCHPYEKDCILKKRNFLQPSDQKKWIPHSIYHQNHYVLGKKNFFKIFEKNGQNYALFCQKSDKIRKMISKPLAQFSSKKFDYSLNLPYKHILFE